MKAAASLPLLAALLLLGADLLAPMVGATHTAEDARALLPDFPAPPEEPPAEIPVIPVDRLLRDAYQDVTRELANGYRITGEALAGVESSVPSFIQALYADGLGTDGRAGGFGAWTEVGDAAWGLNTSASASGQWGWSTATGAAGNTPPETRSLLVSPEIDLRNGFVDARAERAGLVANFSAVWSKVFDPAPSKVGGGVVIGSLPFTDTPRNAPDGAFQLRFAARFNLAQGRDGVQVAVFADSPPTDVPPQDLPQHCVRGPATGTFPPAPTCLVISPTLADSPYPATTASDMETGGPTPAFTGTQREWTNYTFDLTPWAGRSVWIAFSLVTFPAVPVENRVYYADAGFLGFHLDDVAVTAPAEAASLRLRPPVSPNDRPAGPDGLPLATVTVAPGTPFTLEADLWNAGFRDQEVIVQTTTLRTEGGVTEPVAGGTRSSAPVLLPAASTLRIREPFDGLPATEGTYRMELSIVRSGPQGGQLATLEADPRDDSTSITFAVRNVTQLLVGAMAASRTQVAAGEPVGFGLEVRNGGNRPSAFKVNACLVRVDAAPSCSAANVDPPSQDVSLAPGEQRTLQWQTSVTDRGQYRLLVSAGQTPAPFHPSLLQRRGTDWTSTFTTANITPDGALTEDAWNRAASYPVPALGPTASVRILNNATALFMALRLPAFTPAVAAYFDDGGDFAVSTTGEDGVVATHVTRATPTVKDVHFDAALGQWVTDAAENGTWGRTTSPATVIEIVRPLAGSSPDDLATIAGGRLGVLLETASRHPFQAYRSNGSLPPPVPVTGGGSAEKILDPVRDVSVSAFVTRPGCVGEPGNVCLRGNDIDIVEGSISETESDLVFTIRTATPRESDSTRNFYQFRFNVGGTGNRVAHATWYPPAGGNGTVVPGGAAREARIEGDSIVIVVSRASVGNPPMGTLLTSTLVDTQEGYGHLHANANTLWSDRAPDTGNGPPYMLTMGPPPSDEGAPTTGSPQPNAAAVRLPTNATDPESPWMSLWQGIRLAAPDTGTAGGFQLLSPGLGVGRGPPSYLLEDLDNCAGLAAWSQADAYTVTKQVNGSVERREQWNCAPYGEGGPLTLYEGVTPDSRCWDGPCPPYSALPGTRTLTSAPIDLSGASSPYVVLDHQYASSVVIADTRGWFGSLESDHNYFVAFGQVIALRGLGRVYLQEFNPATGQWGVTNATGEFWRDGRTFLQPEGGYPDESDVGIADVARNGGPRNISDLCTQGNGGLSCRNDDGRCLDFDPVTGKRRLTTCGFWWPTGAQPLYRPADEVAAVGERFGGSPWVVDRFSLFGTHSTQTGESVLVDARGKTVRLLFEYQGAGEEQSLLDNPFDPEPLDYGWRIRGVAVQEGSQPARDLTVRAVAPAPTYDVALGLGPGTQVPVKVTLANLGSEPLSGVRVRLDLLVLQPSGAAATTTCSETVVGGTVAPGGSINQTLSCALPAIEGQHVLFQARAFPADDGASPTGGDDFTGNNHALAGPFVVRAAPDLAITVASTLSQGGSPDLQRELDIRVQNRGNVPVTAFQVTKAIITQEGGTLRELPGTRTWNVTGVLPVGGPEVRLSSLVTSPTFGAADRTFVPNFSGIYTLMGQVALGGDTNASNDRAGLEIRAVDALYSHQFDGTPPEANAAVVLGDGAIAFAGEAPGQPVWSLHEGALLAGDAATGNLPVGADAQAVLPRLDLTTVKAATLTLRHRYELEEQFDAARLEVSTDGGQTWSPVPPVARPAFPRGYPEIALLGGSAFGGSTQPIAFTGSSLPYADDPDDADGWMTSEFDLAAAPGLALPSNVEAYRIQGSPVPGNVPQVSPTGDAQFTHPNWTMGNPDDAVRQKYWWIQDAAYDVAPRSGARMWWSGTAGDRPDAGSQAEVHTRLEYQLPARDPTTRPGETVQVSWWEWRPGFDDGTSLQGSGAVYRGYIRASDTDRDGLYDHEEAIRGTNVNGNDTDGDSGSDGAEVRAGTNPLLASSNFTAPTCGVPADWYDGGSNSRWTAMMACSSNGGDGDGDGVHLRDEFAYGTSPLSGDSDQDGLGDALEISQGSDPTRADLGNGGAARQRSEDGWVLRTLDVSPRLLGAGTRPTLVLDYRSGPTAGNGTHQRNTGWFVDDLAVTSLLPGNRTGALAWPILLAESSVDGSGVLLDPSGVSADGQWASLRPSPGTTAAVRWAPVVRGQASKAPALGWHIESQEVPGRGQQATWRFSDSSDQGMPNGLDVRLVTPVADLDKVSGTQARLRFDHKYGFEARCSMPGDSSCTGTDRFVAAMDGGAVEFQIYDEGTGEFGAWQQLGANFTSFPDGFLFSAPNVSGELRSVRGHFAPNASAQRAALAATGYSAIEYRGYDVRDVNATTDFRLRMEPAGHGTSFPVRQGASEYYWGDVHLNFIPSPYSVVFSGQSGGWTTVDWDISPLIGKKVRFAFHAATNPSYTQSFTQDDDGWSIANVVVLGDAFQGREAQLRLRVATDASGPKGSWAIDSIEVTGALYNDNVAVRPTGPLTALALPGTTLNVTGTVANLGQNGRSGLTLAVSAVDDAQSPVPVTISTFGAGPPLLGAPIGGSVAVAAFNLTAGGRPGSSIPFRINVTLPAMQDNVTLRAQLLEDRDGTGYRTPINEVAGNTFATWRLTGALVSDLQRMAPTSGRVATLVAEPANPALGQPVLLKAGVANNGTTTPNLVAEWNITELERKGDPSTQNETTEIILTTVQRTSTVGPLTPGTSAVTSASFTPMRDGLYRATVRYVADGALVLRDQYEFFVGPGGLYYSVDFGTSGDAAQWRDASPTPVNGVRGGTPGTMRFRHDGSNLLWGVDNQQANEGDNYCTIGACNGPAKVEGDPNIVPGSYRGLEGVAVSPPIDLGRVPQGSALLAIRHTLGFEARDGARLEATPYRSPPNPALGPTPAFVCGDGRPASFILEPRTADEWTDVAGSERGGQIFPDPTPPTGAAAQPQWAAVPDRIHPLAPLTETRPILGGSAPMTTSLFALDKPALSTCTSGAHAGYRLNLVNYTLSLRLVTGTLPGVAHEFIPASYAREGKTGWRIHSIAIASTGVELGPETQTVPLREGTAKDFSFVLRNLGQIPDRFRLALVPEASELPEGATLVLPTPEVALDPGQQVVVPFRVSVPAGQAVPGLYRAVVEARSVSVPALADVATVLLGFQAPPLADLALELALEAPSSAPQLEAGTVTSVFATVRNLGATPSPQTVVSLASGPEGGPYQVFATSSVGALCPTFGTCTGQPAETLAVEWAVPAAPGAYRIVATVDPLGRVEDGQRGNNLRELAVSVIPLQVADVAVTGIEVDGIGADGLAEDGSLIVVRAIVQNIGGASAQGVEVQLFANGQQLTQATLEALPAGSTRTLQAVLPAARGDLKLMALAIVPGADRNLDNHDFTRILRVRGHDLRLSLSGGAPAIAPGEVGYATLLVENRGNAPELVEVSTAPRAGWATSAEPNPLQVPAGGTATAFLRIRPPVGAAAGVAILDAVARPASSPNSVARTEVPVVVAVVGSAPVLRIADLATTPGAAALAVTLASQGNRADSVRLSLVEPAWPSANVTAALSPGGTSAHALPFTVPAQEAPGRRTAVVEARDATGAVVAVGSGNITVLGAPHATSEWAGMAAPSFPAPGVRGLQLDLRITNVGNVPITAAASGRDLGPGLAIAPATTVAPVAPMASAVLRLQLRASGNATDLHQGSVEVTIAPVNATNPSGPAGPAFVLTTLALPNLAAAPDLRIGSIEPSIGGAAKAGRAVTYRVPIENAGNAPSPPTRLTAFVNGDLVDDPKVPAIAPGGRADINVTLTFEREGRFLLTFLADGAASTLEAEEGNNGEALAVAVVAPKALSLEGVERSIPAAGALPHAALAALAAVAWRRRRAGGNE